MTFQMLEDWWGKTWKTVAGPYKGLVKEDPSGKGFYWGVEEDGEIIVSGCESSPFTAMRYILAAIATYSGGQVRAG